MLTQTVNKDSILLLCKKPGATSFQSLAQVKKALATTKVGHTGTLDSFACGLLVVCTGHLTKLASKITGFDKTYQAVIEFGSETDTLEYTGNIVKKASLPSLTDLENSIKKWTGTIDQIPPVFSAIHIDGKRASALTRSGEQVEMPSRKVTVYKSELLETKLEGDKVKYAHIRFVVSKGTYIRSLARDIADSCGSAGHLVGLFRTQVGSFDIKDSVFYDEEKNFCIDYALGCKDAYLEQQKSESGKERKPFNEDNLSLIRASSKEFTVKMSEECGLNSIIIKEDGLADFYNGRPLKSKNFYTSLFDLPNNSDVSVFTEDGDFCGMINKNQEGRVGYSFVIHK